MRLIDADRIIFDYSGLVRIPPNDGYSIAKYFADQIKAMPSITTPPNDPLTLAELREMGGEPVYIMRMESDEPTDRDWALVDLKYDMCRTVTGGMAIFELYGKTWLAYRRKPEEGTT